MPLRALREMMRLTHRTKVIIGFLILAVGIAAAIGFQTHLTNEVKAHDNATRCAIVTLVKTLTDNTSRSAHATIESKFSTQQQRQAAARNLEVVRDALVKTSAVLHHPVGADCENLNP